MYKGVAATIHHY